MSRKDWGDLQSVFRTRPYKIYVRTNIIVDLSQASKL